MDDIRYYPVPLLPKIDHDTLSLLYPPHYKLLHVQIIHRHGHRTPFTNRLASIFPYSWILCHKDSLVKVDGNCPSKNLLSSIEFTQTGSRPPLLLLFNTSSTFPRNTKNPDSTSIYRPGSCFPGQLTDKGQECMQSLGQTLRTIYVDHIKLLPESWNESSSSMLYLRSTAYFRTIKSLQSLIVGLYPNTHDSIPYHVNMRLPDSETMYPWLQCPKLKGWMDHYERMFKSHYSSDIEKIKSKLSNLFSQSDPLGTYPSLQGLFDTLYCARENGLLESCTDKIISDSDLYELERLSNIKWFSPFTCNNQVSRLGMGEFIKELLTELSSHVLGSNDTRMSIYSGHDTTIGPLLGSFGFNSSRWPPFGANMAIELIFDTKLSNHYVRIKYNDQVITSCLRSIAVESSKHPDDSTLYPFDDFANICEKLIPIDLIEECNKDD